VHFLRIKYPKIIMNWLQRIRQLRKLRQLQRMRRMQRRQRLRIQRQRRQQEMLRERLRLEQLNSTRYALLTGINYIGTPYTLNGCINDIDNMRDFLQTRRFQSDNIRMLSDGSDASDKSGNYVDNKPTKSTILNELKALLERGQAGDMLFFHYSGHGGQLRDRNGDERDGRDECIYSCLLETISDDQFKSMIHHYLKPRVTLVCLMDCCNSGTGLDLRFNCKNNGRIVANRRQQPTRGNVYMLSGCKDPQTSADAWLNGQFAGAMTTAFLQMYQPNESWGQLLNKMQWRLREQRFTQIPQLSSGRRFLVQQKNGI